MKSNWPHHRRDTRKGLNPRDRAKIEYQRRRSAHDGVRALYILRGPFVPLFYCVCDVAVKWPVLATYMRRVLSASRFRNSNPATFANCPMIHAIPTYREHKSYARRILHRYSRARNDYVTSTRHCSANVRKKNERIIWHLLKDLCCLSSEHYLYGIIKRRKWHRISSGFFVHYELLKGGMLSYAPIMYRPINLMNIPIEPGRENNNNNPELLTGQTFRIKAAALIDGTNG